VRYKASIQQIQGETVTVQTAGPEVVCLELEREVVLLGEGAVEALRAKVAEVQLARGVAQLENLHYADTRLSNRLMVRVEPKAPMAARLEAGGQTGAGRVVDVSMGGLAVEVVAMSPELPVKLRAPLRLAFNLPSGPVELVGILRSIRPAGEAQRLGIAFAQDAQVNLIVGYVLQRRVEILGELRAVYEARVGKA